MTSDNNHLIITAGYKCNSNCVMCVVGSKFHNDNNSTTEEIINILSEGAKNKTISVEFSGGEPTIRKDLNRLVSSARNLGYKKIGISTNGMKLSDNNFCEKLVKAGLTYVTFSLHAPNETINRSITNTPNSFSRTISGIKNALKHKNLEINVVTAVQKYNLKYLVEIGNLIHSFGVRSWTICDLTPKGMAKEKYAALSISRTDLFETLKDIISMFDDMNLLLFGFTQCTIPSDFPIHNLVTISRKCTEHQYISLVKGGVFKDTAKKEYTEENLKKIDICHDCIYSEKCVGFWSDYFSIYGEAELKELAIKNGCVKKII